MLEVVGGTPVLPWRPDNLKSPPEHQLELHIQQMPMKLGPIVWTNKK